MTSKMICTSITNTDFDACRLLLLRSEMAELRLDLMRLQAVQIQALMRDVHIPIVATCREGHYGEADRLRLLQVAVECGAAYVDVEIEADNCYHQTLVELARRHRCSCIVSYHNFEHTPDLSTLRGIVDSCRSKGADVVKLITTARTASDCARLMSLYEDEKSLIAFAMGELGKFTRVACLHLGAPFTYAASGVGSEAAPGQLEVGKLQQMLHLLHPFEI
jgi:3-dehydroquinate dehydratase-1